MSAGGPGLVGDPTLVDGSVLVGDFALVGDSAMVAVSTRVDDPTVVDDPALIDHPVVDGSVPIDVAGVGGFAVEGFASGNSSTPSKMRDPRRRAWTWSLIHKSRMNESLRWMRSRAWPQISVLRGR